MIPVGLETKNCCVGEGQQKFIGLDWTMYLPTVARQRLGKHVPAATKNCWRRHFLWGRVVSTVESRYLVTSNEDKTD
jgi:hypothetical protein